MISDSLENNSSKKIAKKTNQLLVLFYLLHLNKTPFRPPPLVLFFILDPVFFLPYTRFINEKIY